MKKIPNYKGQTPGFVSEGKLLEVTPIITDGAGMPMILPPVVWPVENWVLGYLDEHAVGSPYTCYVPWTSEIPGSHPAMNHRIAFTIRVLEAGQAPRPGPALDNDTVRELIAQVRAANDTRPVGRNR